MKNRGERNVCGQIELRDSFHSLLRWIARLCATYDSINKNSRGTQVRRVCCCLHLFLHTVSEKGTCLSFLSCFCESSHTSDTRLSCRRPYAYCIPSKRTALILQNQHGRREQTKREEETFSSQQNCQDRLSAVDYLLVIIVDYRL
jgi:hypothetical protein